MGYEMINKRFLGAMLFLVLSTIVVEAADPGHSASSISAGTFEAGNYILEGWINENDRKTH